MALWNFVITLHYVRQIIRMIKKNNIIIIINIGFGGNAFVAETEDLNLSHKHRK